MQHVREIDDASLFELAHWWRRKAMRGDMRATRKARALEIEMRRRLGYPDTVSGPLESVPMPLPRPSRPWWKFW